MFDRRVTAGPTIKTRDVFVAAFLTCFFLSSAVSEANGDLFPVGVEYEYDFHSSVLSDGSSGQAADDSPIGHRVIGRLSVANVWSSSADKLLRLQVSNLHDRNFIIFNL